MLYDKIKKYTKSGVYPFHMPGHKRNTDICDKELPYNIDITEIDDFDNLHNPNGCIKSLIDYASKTYSVKHANVLVNGATVGVLSAIKAMTKYNDRVIVARNCHKSVYNAIELLGLRPRYILPEIDEEFGIFGSINPEEIERLILKYFDVKLIILTSPTYEGVVSDISAICKIAHKYNVKVFVDEAHGAHFPFSNSVPNEAVSLSADAAVVSLHKTLPSLTQTALFLTNDDNLFESFNEQLSIFESSSPSYVLMSSVENCLDIINDKKYLFTKWEENLTQFSKSVSSLKKLKILCYGNDSKDNHDFYSFDKAKIVISTMNTNISGIELAEILRSKYKFEVEMAYLNYVVAITTICDKEEYLKKFADALIEIDSNISKANEECTINFINRKIPKPLFYARRKPELNGSFTMLKDCENKASLEYIWSYPPGIPIVVPGEIIDKNIIDNISYLSKNGVNIYSTKQKVPNQIFTVIID